MLTYRCTRCNRMFGFLTVPSLSVCAWCGGRLVYLSSSPNPEGNQLSQAPKKKEKRDLQSLWSFLKGLGLIWGAINIAGKSLGKEKIGKKDLFHVLFPSATVGILHAFQHGQEIKKYLTSLRPQVEMDARTRQEMISLIEKVKKGPSVSKSQAISEILPPKELDGDTAEFDDSSSDPVVTLPEKTSYAMADPWALKWLKILSEHPRILILGAQGSGKSCLGFYLLEIMSYRAHCYVYHFPEEGGSLLPEGMGILREFTHAPPGSLILVDEAYLAFFSRDSQTTANKEITRVVNLARQKEISLIFVAHESRHLEKNILSGIDTLILKKPTPLQVGLDRSLLKTYLLKAEQLFQGKDELEAKTLSYIAFSPSGFEGMLENPKPSFWTEELSHIFASGQLGREERPARQLTKEEKRERAKELRQDYGYSYGNIARQINLPKTTVYRWLHEDSDNGTGG